MSDKVVPLSNKELTAIVRALHEGASIGDVCNITDEQIEALYALAYNLYTSGSFTDAETVFQALCLYRHREPRFWMGLAGCRQARGNLKGAVDAYGMAGTVGLLTDPEPFLYAARCYIQMGDKENAQNAIKGLLTLGNEENPAHALCHEKARTLLTMLEN
jgi:type III secretion system low calcium response chaperone LcrH/SycD